VHGCASLHVGYHHCPGKLPCGNGISLPPLAKLMNLGLHQLFSRSIRRLGAVTDPEMTGTSSPASCTRYSYSYRERVARRTTGQRTSGSAPISPSSSIYPRLVALAALSETTGASRPAGHRRQVARARSDRRRKQHGHPRRALLVLLFSQCKKAKATRMSAARMNALIRPSRRRRLPAADEDARAGSGPSRARWRAPASSAAESGSPR
jgi:hypothetical protein